MGRFIMAALSMFCIAVLSGSLAFVPEAEDRDAAPVNLQMARSAASACPDGDDNGHFMKRETPPAHLGPRQYPVAPANKSLGELLAPDGTLAGPSVGSAGSVDPSGFDLVSGLGEPPRFKPAAEGAGPRAAGDERWDPRFTRRGVGGTVRAFAWDGANLYIGGDFKTAGGVTVNGVAKWDGTSWSALGSGIIRDRNTHVHALAWDGANLYVGGDFSQAGGIPAASIAKWNGDAWSTLDIGVYSHHYDNHYYGGIVNSLAWDGAYLYVGGNFKYAGGMAVNNIAKWDGSAWSALGLGLYSEDLLISLPACVYALVWSGTHLYAGGDFRHAGEIVANNVAQWDGAAWQPVGTGMTNDDWWGAELSWRTARVFTLAWDGTSLYAGGGFKKAGGVAVNRVAKWDGTAWSALGTGTNHYVQALAWDGTGLLAGGYFTTMDGLPVHRIARWNGSAWAPVGAVTDGAVLALLQSGAALYAGGEFSMAGGTVVGHIARWNGAEWSALTDSGMGLNDTVMALAADGTDLYAGGYFTTAGGVAANHIAKWDGVAWSPLGEGTNEAVHAMVVGGGNLYVGGYFTAAGGVPAAAVAKWDGTSWSALGSGLYMSPWGRASVHALAWDGANLYAGGDFTVAGVMAANFIAKWDGVAWSPLGAGMGHIGSTEPEPPATVYSLAWDGSSLYAGGRFTSAGGATANRIAKWDGTAWSPLGSGMEGPSGSWWENPIVDVTALAWDGVSLFAGGDFTSAGGADICHIARWDGSAWSALGGGIDYAVSALGMEGGDLYAGGWFWNAGGAPAAKLAKWDGAAWGTLGSGANAMVNALARMGDGLYAGGEFSAVGGKVSSFIGRWGLCRTPVPPSAIGPVEDADPCADTGVWVRWPADAVEWGDGGLGERSYDVLRDGEVIADHLAYGTTQFLDAGGAHDTTYPYTVRYRNGCLLSAVSPGVAAMDDPGAVPIVMGPSPACGSALLDTQPFAAYQWMRNGSIIPGATGQAYSALVNGTYGVAVVDAQGCHGTSPGFVIAPFPPVPVVSGPDTGCASTGAWLSTQDYDAFQWTRDGEDIPGATARTHLALQSGAYRVRAANAAGCRSTSGEHAVAIGGFPVIEGPHFNTCPEPSVTLTTGDYSEIQWHLNGDPIPEAVGRTYTAGVSGIYSVTATDPMGCEESSSGFIVFVDFCPGSEVSPAAALFPLRITKSSASSTGYHLTFQRLDSVEGFNLYEGLLVTPWDGQYHHAGQPGTVCGAAFTDLGTGEMRVELDPGAGDHYYLVTAFGGGAEGPSGFDSRGLEVPASQSSCAP